MSSAAMPALKKAELILAALQQGLVASAEHAESVAVLEERIGAPVFFRQQRPGLHGQPFQMVKFRTMTDARDASGALLPDADPLTPFGRFLRSSLDGLPELRICQLVVRFSVGEYTCAFLRNLPDRSAADHHRGHERR